MRRTRDWVHQDGPDPVHALPVRVLVAGPGADHPGRPHRPAQRQRILEGRAFEELAVKEIAETSAIPVAVGPDRKQVGRLLGEDIMLLRTPDFDNPTLKLYGRPDASTWPAAP